MSQARGGLYRVTVDGVQQECSGVCTYGLGVPKRKAVMGSHGRPVGYTEEGQAPFVEVEVLDDSTLDVKALCSGQDVTVVVDLANGKSVVLSHGWFAGDAEGETEKGVIKARWEGTEGNEV